MQEAWLRDLPKAELHLHLDGSLRPATALELARRALLDERRSAADARMLLEAARLSDPASMRARLVAPERCADQAELLRAFDLPIALLQDPDSLERVAHELVEDAASDGTRYVEVRWAPALHLRLGLSLSEGITAVVRGAASGARSSGIVARLVAVAMRTEPSSMAEEVARVAAAFLPDGLTGFDLAGREGEAPDPLPFRGAFDIARERGLGITCHAGEWGGADQVRRALEIRPARIAHGAPAVDDEALVRRLREEGVTLDLCPTSSVQAGVVDDLAGHPLARLARAGVPVTLSTDDRTVSDLTLVREYGRALDAVGLTITELLAIARHAFDAAFLQHDAALRAGLLAEHDAWIAAHPRPAEGMR